MSLKTYREAINEALLQEMKKDENVVYHDEFEVLKNLFKKMILIL